MDAAAEEDATPATTAKEDTTLEASAKKDAAAEVEVGREEDAEKNTKRHKIIEMRKWFLNKVHFSLDMAIVQVENASASLEDVFHAVHTEAKEDAAAEK